MTNEYLNSRNKKLANAKERDNFIFGLVFGMILFYLNIVIYLFSEENMVADLINVTWAAIGLIIVIISAIAPNLLDRLHRLFSFVTKKIGETILKILLLIMYYLIIVPTGFIMRKKDKKSGIKENTNFVDIDENVQNVIKKKGMYNIFYIFKIFANEKYALMLPLLVILIILGLLLIFVQSSAIAPFIYTIF